MAMTISSLTPLPEKNVVNFYIGNALYLAALHDGFAGTINTFGRDSTLAL